MAIDWQRSENSNSCALVIGPFAALEDNGEAVVGSGNDLKRKIYWGFEKHSFSYLSIWIELFCSIHCFNLGLVGSHLTKIYFYNLPHVSGNSGLMDI